MKTPAFIKLVSLAGNKHESVMELNILPGEKTPWHYHTDFSETFEVLKGTLEVGGLESLTRYFAKEFAARKIRFNSVAPGAIDTEFGGGKGDEAHRQQIAAAIALNRLGEAGDTGLFIASLLSDDSRYLNAQRIEVSGGNNDTGLNLCPAIKTI